MNVGFYVTIVRGQRRGYLAGPFATKAEAEAAEWQVCSAAHDVDPWTAFDAFGITRVESSTPLPPGVLNPRLNLRPS